MSSREATIRFLQDLNLLPKLPSTIEACGIHNSHDWYLANVARSTDGYNFRCCRCHTTKSLRAETFFEQSHLPLDSIFEIMYYWSRQEDSIDKLMHELGIGSRKTVVD
ncbi:unnamed protein product [Rotaria sp. Silwood2]|nr:unnamed protein product [Rotaria sp. Silwood2]CAF4644692.1 unnamed protein product [Rotaria sp. Silwood2]